MSSTFAVPKSLPLIPKSSSLIVLRSISETSSPLNEPPSDPALPKSFPVVPRSTSLVGLRSISSSSDTNWEAVTDSENDSSTEFSLMFDAGSENSIVLSEHNASLNVVEGSGLGMLPNVNPPMGSVADHSTHNTLKASNDNVETLGGETPKEQKVYKHKNREPCSCFGLGDPRHGYCEVPREGLEPKLIRDFNFSTDECPQPGFILYGSHRPLTKDMAMREQWINDVFKRRYDHINEQDEWIIFRPGIMEYLSNEITKENFIKIHNYTHWNWREIPEEDFIILPTRRQYIIDMHLSSHIKILIVATIVALIEKDYNSIMAGIESFLLFILMCYAVATYYLWDKVKTKKYLVNYGTGEVKEAKEMRVLFSEWKPNYNRLYV